MGILTSFLYTIVTRNISILYGTVGEILVEKSGSLNLGVEGTMAIGAIAGYLAAVNSGSFLLGVIVAFITGGLCGLLFAFLTVTLQANQNVTGLTLTTFGVGLFYFVGNGVTSSGKWIGWADWPESIKNWNGDIEIPLLSKIPVIGPALFNHNILVYLGIIIAVVSWFYLKYTKMGLKTTAIGENPAAADAVGVNVVLYKYLNIIIGSGIMGIGGLYMGYNLNGNFEASSCWIGGYGWISIALVIFAKWNPAVSILGTFVFGFFNTLQVKAGSIAESVHIFSFLKDIPSQLYEALPFIITAIVLVVASVSNKKGTGPAAIGVNYYREAR